VKDSLSRSSASEDRRIPANSSLEPTKAIDASTVEAGVAPSSTPPDPPAPVVTKTRPPDWKRFVVRFLGLYALLFSFPGPIDPLDLGDRLRGLIAGPVAWIAVHVLGCRNILSHRLGQTDRLLDWVFSLCLLVTSALIALAWTLRDRDGGRRLRSVEQDNRYEMRLRDIVIVYVRFTLAAQMLSYGVLKVFAGQFPHPNTASLLQRLGQSSKMALLWNCMGVAPAYQIFGGALEVIGGLLLFSRRTTALGATICAGVLANVVMLNFSYDIAVKQFSSHLLLFSLGLLLSQWRRFVDFFVLNRAAATPVTRAPFASKRLERAAVILKVVAALYLIVFVSKDAYGIAQNNLAGEPVWTGAYEVTTFNADGRELPNTYGDATRFRRVVLFDGAMIAELGDDTRELWLMERDVERKRMVFRKDSGSNVIPPGPPGEARFDDAIAQELLIEGDLGGRNLRFRLRREATVFQLATERIHLVDDGTLGR
jgi:hypothetical protein